MQRGVMQLLAIEIREAINNLPDSCVKEPLYSKFLSAIEFNSPRVGIQFSANELELILDCLGAPLPDDSLVKKSLRKKIQTFLYFLRNESLKISK